MEIIFFNVSNMGMAILQIYRFLVAPLSCVSFGAVTAMQLCTYVDTIAGYGTQFETEQKIAANF
jgi:hypothetical protein